MKFCRYRFTDGPSRGLACNTPLIATCDRSKPSEPTEFKGRDWTKKKPQKMAMYPTAEKQDNLCFWHQRRNVKDKVGKGGKHDLRKKRQYDLSKFGAR